MTSSYCRVSEKLNIDFKAADGASHSTINTDSISCVYVDSSVVNMKPAAPFSPAKDLFVAFSIENDKRFD